MYVLTMLWEWSVVAYVAWGVKRHGSSLRDIIGGKLSRATDFLMDVGIAAGFWLIALTVLFCTAVALHATTARQNIRFFFPPKHLGIFLEPETEILALSCGPARNRPV